MEVPLTPRQALDMGFCVLSLLHDDPTVAATLGCHHAPRGRVTRRRRPTATTGLSALGALATPHLFGSIVVRILPLAVRDAAGVAPLAVGDTVTLTPPEAPHCVQACLQTDAMGRRVRLPLPMWLWACVGTCA